jgi:hypothetical protein
MSLNTMLAIVAGMAVLGASPVQAANQEDSNTYERASKLIEKGRQQVPELGRLVSEIRGPEDHDRATAALAMNASLVNIHLSTKVTTPLGPALHIPIQISKREGGRKSLYFISPREQIIAGIYIIDSTIYYRAIRRDSGNAIPAETGDVFTELILARDGTVVHEAQGMLRILDFSRGVGVLEPIVGASAGETEPVPNSKVWVLWSCVLVEET